MEVSEVCLKWNTYHESMISSFESLWEEENLVDVTISTGNQMFNTHKVILSACSPFFKNIFKENDNKHPVIVLPDANVNHLKILLNYIYKGEIFIKEEELPEFLKLAESLQIKGLWIPSSVPDTFNQLDFQLSDSNKSHSHGDNENNISPHIQFDEESLTTINKKKSDLNCAPHSKRIKRSYLQNSPISEFNKLIVPKCKTEIRESDKGAYSVENEQNCNTNLEWQKIADNRVANDKTSLNFGEESDRIYPYMDLPYADLLPSPITLQMWAYNRTLDQFACDLMKMLFSTEERIVCNVNGKMGKIQFNVDKIKLIREVIKCFCNLSTAVFEEHWKVCVTKIDTTNRGLKRRFKTRETVFCNRNF